MTSAAEPPPAPTVVLLAEPGAGRARRLAIALRALGVAAAEVEEAADAEPVDDEDGEAAPGGRLDLGTVHEQALDAVAVRADDARPSAWPDVAGGIGAETEAAVASWLERQLAATSFPLVADRRLHWLLPVWVRACEEIGVRVVAVIAVRRPDRAAEPLPGSVGRPEITGAAAWLNQTLHVERATRDLPRVVVTTGEVAEDWVAATARVGEALDLDIIRDAAATTIRSAQQALDRAPGTAVEPAAAIDLPPRLQEQVERVWGLLAQLAKGEDTAAVREQLDAARAAYSAYYLEAESVAISSVRAARAARRAAKEAAAAAPAPAEEPPASGRSLPWRRAGRSEGS